MWLKNKPYGFIKSSSLKINIQNEISKNPFSNNKNPFNITPKNFVKKN